MMTQRERCIETLTFGKPDKIFFGPGDPPESTLSYWHETGLDPQADWWTEMCKAVGVEFPNIPFPGYKVDFRLIPQYEERILERRDGHLIIQDWQGNVLEISDQYDERFLRRYSVDEVVRSDFVTRSWVKVPVETREDWEQMKSRYDVDTPGRLPDDFLQRCAQNADGEWASFMSFPGLFWQLRDWVGFEGLCMLMLDDPDWVQEMADFWKDFVSSLLERIFEHTTPDHIIINEDMAYKEKAMISPAMTRRFCMPAWTQWASQANQAGVPIFDLDSDGCIAELIPLWIESSINCSSPCEVAAGNDLVALRKTFGDQMAFHGGVDKRCIAAGGQVMRDELERLRPVVESGGYFPSCDHGVPPNVTWPKWLDYCCELAKLTGWV